jgi:hypothetical protein
VTWQLGFEKESKRVGGDTSYGTYCTPFFDLVDVLLVFLPFFPSGIYRKFPELSRF